MGSSPRKYEETFKRAAVGQLKEGRTVVAVSKDLGITADLLSKWRRRYEEEAEAGIETIETLKSKVRTLERRAAQAEMERDILKKSISIFSRLPSERS